MVETPADPWVRAGSVYNCFYKIVNIRTCSNLSCCSIYLSRISICGYWSSSVVAHALAQSTCCARDQYNYKGCRRDGSCAKYNCVVRNLTSNEDSHTRAILMLVATGKWYVYIQMIRCTSTRRTR